jgi:hypothetical protein
MSSEIAVASAVPRRFILVRYVLSAGSAPTSQEEARMNMLPTPAAPPVNYVILQHGFRHMLPLIQELFRGDPNITVIADRRKPHAEVPRRIRTTERRRPPFHCLDVLMPLPATAGGVALHGLLNL